MGEYKSGYTGRRIDELLSIVDKGGSLSGDLTAKNLTANEKITAKEVQINGRKYGENKILWQGSKLMNVDSAVKFDYGKSNGELHKASEQPHGIVLVFSYFEKNEGDTSSQPQDHSWSCHFVPKEMIELNNGGAHTFLMTINATMKTFGAKHLRISDTGITGDAANSQAATADCGIQFANNHYVLRYVIGV